MSELSCDAVHSLVPELALGLLHGRERAQVLAHIERCPACQHELLLMGDVADRLVELTPPAEPPAGFETGVMTALHKARPPAPSSPTTGLRRPLRKKTGGSAPGRWLRPAAAGLAAAAVTASVGVGGWVLGHHGAQTSPPAVASAPGKAVVAELLNHQQRVGQVVVTDDPYPWMWMSVSSSLGDARVTCEISEKNGRWVQLGSFNLTHGSGYWAAPMPETSSPITGARVVDAGGRTLGAASISVQT
ncbi:MAG: zf-HC2 domain-containing protein [Acidimicrobiaceae bacterium]|nr:zf-HC2 domain-containing protein [Acidimicrobiaceae bacterium]